MSGLAAFQGRVVAEKAELDDRLDKLLAFHGTPIFTALPVEEQNRLCRQADLMAELSTVLGERIDNFIKE